MSLLSPIAPIQAANATWQGPQRQAAAPLPGQTHRAAAEGQPTGDATVRAGVGTVGEITQTALRVPPVTAARRTNASTTARDGGEGRADPEASATSDAEAHARAMEEALRRKALRREMMELIPVPVEAIPKLTGDLEVMRSIEKPKDGPAHDTVV